MAETGLEFILRVESEIGTATVDAYWAHAKTLDNTGSYQDAAAAGWLTAKTFSAVPDETEALTYYQVVVFLTRATFQNRPWAS